MKNVNNGLYGIGKYTVVGLYMWLTQITDVSLIVIVGIV